jgi:hypothetical protein
MINLGARYIDYGLTGGFFLFLGIAMIGWYHPAAVLMMLENLQKNLPAGEAKAFETLLNGIFASLFVVCVFATGLLLDLVGSLLSLAFFEADVFVRHLKRNKAWIGQLLAKYEEFLGSDVNQFLTFPNLWKPSVDPRLTFRRYRLIAPFDRIESILLSHLLLTADPTKLELVMDQVRTCRVARAVSSGLVLLSVVFSQMPVIEGVHRFDWRVLAISIIGLVLSAFIVRRAYSKFCSSLFSLLFVLQMQESALGQNR